jgi:hypothetical protein
MLAFFTQDYSHILFRTFSLDDCIFRIFCLDSLFRYRVLLALTFKLTFTLALALIYGLLFQPSAFHRSHCLKHLLKLAIHYVLLSLVLLGGYLKTLMEPLHISWKPPVPREHQS